MQGKKVFVTGADGFIGSHLLEELVKEDAEVNGLVFYNSWNQIGWLNDLDQETLSKINLVFGDVRDSDFISKYIKKADYVFHLSSLIGIPYSYEAPLSYVSTNILGATNVLQSCRKNKKLKKLIHVSTSEVYGSAQQVPIKEDHPLVGQSPYSASKIAADKLAESFFLSFGTPLVIARPFNTFGPRQTSRAVIPTIISQIVSGSKEIQLGSLEPTRDFNYVTDTAKAMIELALSKDIDGEVVNIGSGTEWSIGQTLEIICDLMGKKVKVILDEERLRPEKSEVSRLLSDNSKLKKYTNWEQKISFKEGLRKTIRWIEKNIEKFDPNKYQK
jgi:NAD dependent epimerase/dehydratase